MKLLALLFALSSVSATLWKTYYDFECREPIWTAAQIPQAGKCYDEWNAHSFMVLGDDCLAHLYVGYQSESGHTCGFDSYNITVRAASGHCYAGYHMTSACVVGIKNNDGLGDCQFIDHSIHFVGDPHDLGDYTQKEGKMSPSSVEGQYAFIDAE